MAIDQNDDHLAILNDPSFQTLLSKRSRLRWSLSIFLSATYLGYGLLGVYFPDVMARPFFGTAMPWVMFMGYLIILLSIVLSIAYIRLVNNLILERDSDTGAAD